MLLSGLNIKTLTESVRPAESKDESEIVACIAAVHAYLEIERQELERAASASRTVTGPNAWRRSALLEGAGIKKELRNLPANSKLSPGSLWRFSSLVTFGAFSLVSALLASNLCFALPACADDLSTSGDFAPEQIAVNKSSMQRFVPVQTPSKRTLIKVGLLVKVSRAEIEALDGAEVRDAGTGAMVASLPAQSQWYLGIDSARNISFTGKNNVEGVRLAGAPDQTTYSKVAYFPTAPRPEATKFLLPKQSGYDTAYGVSGYLVVPKDDKKGDQVISLNGKLYRGAIWLKPGAQDAASDSSGITAINIVDLEDYLLSVLPSEMPASWPLEALKAQAVAARSYAIANIGKHSKDGYDLRATVDDQVYMGVASENPNSNRAVAETEGLILKHEGKPVSAFFHSTSGGSTEVAEFVWGRSVPYLRMVPDYDDLSPHFAWSRKVRVDEMARVAGPEIGQLTAFSITSRSPSNRVKETQAVGTAGAKILTGDALRKLFKLPSTNFNVVCKDNCFEFLGRGNGHGLGLSQWGARALAEHGYNAAQILTYYYKDVSVDYLADSVGI